MNKDSTSCAINDDDNESPCLEQYLQPEILRYIFSFIGRYEYRFIAAVSKTFRTLYIKQHRTKLTNDTLAGLSLYHAKAYYEDMSNHSLSKKWFVYYDGDDLNGFRKVVVGSVPTCKHSDVILFITRHAIMNGRVDVVEWLLSFDETKFRQLERTFAFELAAEMGQMDCLKCLYTKDMITGNVINKAAKGGNLQILKFLCTNYSGANEAFLLKDACEYACEGGNIECLQYLHGKGARWDGRCYVEAAKRGHLECIMYLYENHCTSVIGIHNHAKDIMEVAAKNSFECFRYLDDHNFSWDNHEMECFKAAARGGNIECLRYMYNINHPDFAGGQLYTYSLTWAAVEPGSLECLQFLHKKGCRLDDRTTIAASISGSVECLRYLHDNGCQLDHKLCREAIKAGSIECLRYLHEHGIKCFDWLYSDVISLQQKFPKRIVPFFLYLSKTAKTLPTPEAVEWANDNNMISLLQWKKPRTYAQFCFMRAIEDGFLDIYEESWKYDTRYCRKAAERGNLSVLQELLEHGFVAPKNIFEKAARNGHIKCLKFLHQNGFRLTRHAMDAAIRNDHLDCIIYCTEQGVQPSSRK